MRLVGTKVLSITIGKQNLIAVASLIPPSQLFGNSQLGA